MSPVRMSLAWLEDPPPPPQLGFDLGEADGRVPAVPAYYDIEQQWRPASLERRRLLRGR